MRWYAELERGQRNPTLRTLFDLAQILDVAPVDLLDVPGTRRGPRLLDRAAAPPKRGRKPRKKAGRKKS